VFVTSSLSPVISPTQHFKQARCHAAQAQTLSPLHVQSESFHPTPALNSLFSRRLDNPTPSHQSLFSFGTITTELEPKQNIRHDGPLLGADLAVSRRGELATNERNRGIFIAAVEEICYALASWQVFSCCAPRGTSVNFNHLFSSCRGLFDCRGCPRLLRQVGQLI
jgi:hypothetical protein